ncbi:MAG: transglutaminase domain-containing protein [Deltaproteobacteria bacterium]|nr:transglutaminase domain-containing protein [Candidatus Anaeroferrophillacea bacterium]
MQSHGTIPADPDACREPGIFIDSGHPAITAAARRLAGDATPPAAAVRLFHFVRDAIRYNPYTFSEHPEDYRASAILGHERGYCIQKAVLLAALYRAAGIPARLHLVDIINHQVPGKLTALMQTNRFICHSYVELMPGDRWLKAAPTFDREMCERIGVEPVAFDGRRDALLPAATLDGKPYIEYDADRGVYDDLPFAQVMNIFRMEYGARLVERWRIAGEYHYEP